MAITVFNPTVYSIDFPYAMRVDESDATGAIVYQGYAPAGALNASEVWALKRISVSAGITTIEWANGNNSMTNVWNDRASATYV